MRFEVPVRLASLLVRELPVNKRKSALVEYSLALGNRPLEFNFRCWRTGVTWSARGFPDLLTRHMLFEGHYQLEVLTALRALVKPGARVFDVGGHHGLMAIIASKAAGRRGEVITFEPNPAARAILREHLALNRVKNVQIETIALDAEEGTRQFFAQSGVVSWNSSFFEAFVSKNNEGRPANSSRELTVETCRLDTYVERTGHAPNVIKIDTEGADFFILQGALKTIEKHQPALVLELNPHSARLAGTSVEAFTSFLGDIGYKIYVLTPSYLGFFEFDRKVEYAHSEHFLEREFNVVCLPPAHPGRRQ